MDKVSLKDVVAKVQKSRKLGAKRFGLKRFGLFMIEELMGRNALRIKLPGESLIHTVIHAEHTKPYRTQPTDLAVEVAQRPAPVRWPYVNVEYVVKEILLHRKRRSNFQFLTVMEGAPQHEAAWQPTKNFVDADGTSNAVFLCYIRRHNLLRHLH